MLACRAVLIVVETSMQLPWRPLPARRRADISTSKQQPRDDRLLTRQVPPGDIPLEISRPIDRLWSGPYITGRLGSVVMVSASFQLFSRGVISGGIFPGGIISCDRDCLFHSG